MHNWFIGRNHLLSAKQVVFLGTLVRLIIPGGAGIGGYVSIMHICTTGDAKHGIGELEVVE